jgi:uncharacterized phage infection (PIP) family protein YhgE
MTDLDDDRLELLERQLAERVTERVRPALFRLYATVGLAVIGALGFVGWDLVSDIKAEIKTEITDSIDEEVTAKRSEIAERVTEARFMAKRAGKVIERVEKQLEDFQPQADNLDETIERVKALNVTSQDLTAIYAQELTPLVANVDSLSRQLRVLAEQVNQLNLIATAGGLSTKALPEASPQQRSAAIQSVITNSKEAELQMAQARKKTTVFFQFAGGRREQAKELSAALKANGYNISGEDREGDAARKHEVRYFHDEDQETARRLAEDTTQALRKLAYLERQMPDVVAKSFESYAGKKPRPGVLELWLEIPPM